MEEKEGERSPDEEKQNIQSTVLAPAPRLPEFLVTLLHSGCCSDRVFKQLVRQLRLLGQMRD